jgi:hypothetical protein
MTTDRKKLSDIGTLITPRPESMTQFYPFVQMTLEERRELVDRFARAVYRIMLDDIDMDPTDAINAVIKDEGL